MTAGKTAPSPGSGHAGQPSQAHAGDHSISGRSGTITDGAASTGHAETPSSRSGKHEPRGRTRFGAIGTLRILLVGSIVLPLLLGAVGAYLSYSASYRRAVAALAEAAAVAEENTAKILDTHLLVAARIDDLLAPLSDAEIRAREQSLHEKMLSQIEKLPQVAAAWVIDANGRALVSARVYPVDRKLDHSVREDFRALQDHPGTPAFIWALRARSLESGEVQPYFTVSRRRHTADGGFGGVIVVAVAGDYFASFYNALLGGSAEYAASVLRDDGTTLARYPETGVIAAPGHHHALTKAIAERVRAGVITSGSLFEAPGAVVAYKRLADYPVYVAIGRTQASIRREWLQSTTGYIAIGLPAAIGFILLSLLALRRTRREQAALAQARDAVAQRAAIQSQLHQAQKMEAVGQLTAGIAHDFNNLLTIVAGNIALLSEEIENAEGRRQKLIASASHACDRAAGLTRRLLSFARHEPVDPQPVDVNEVISGLDELPWRILGDRVEFEFRLASGLWTVFVDPSELENVLVNLAINARDAMAGSGRLTIETSNCRFDDDEAAGPTRPAAGDYVAIAVGDTGCGMTRDVIERAFDPFFTTKEPGKGTGLGLAQVRGFVTRFGGSCTIDSEPGVGTTVKLYLPRYQEGSHSQAATAGGGEAPGETGGEAPGEAAPSAPGEDADRPRPVHDPGRAKDEGG